MNPADAEDGTTIGEQQAALSEQHGQSPDPDELRAQIEHTREELAQTVEAIADKVNVKKQAGEKIDVAKHRLGDAAAHARSSAPPPVQHALDTVGEKAAPVARRAEPYRNQILAGVGVLLVLVVIKRRRGGSS